MVWLGILIDAVPESLVIGILLNKANGETAAVIPFVIGVFLSNLPESMSSAGMMQRNGMRVRTILLMWTVITVLTAFGAGIGALAFPPGSDKDPSTRLIVAGVEGLAAGAMLTMIAQTMMPEAFGQGGDVVGLSCLAGFLCALSVKLLPL
jgi:zinc transporter ZupT